MQVNLKVNWKLKSQKIFEIAVVISLSVHIAIVHSFREFKSQEALVDSSMKILNVEDIPETEQFERPPPPAAPAVPVESLDEHLLDDITIEDTDIIDFSRFEAPPPPPPKEEEEIPDFLPLQDQPHIIGGYEALQKLVKYPEIALRTVLEGLVIVSVLINEKGVPIDFEVSKSMGNNGCDEAAIDAIKQICFTPAKQRGRPVKFWVNIPIRYF